jgi:adenosylmethionine-8-amino-7-oxononanoate aminotransferase
MKRPTVTTAQGIYLYDETGKDYLDGSSGVLNVNLGHSHPIILQAITDQLRRSPSCIAPSFGPGR